MNRRSPNTRHRNLEFLPQKLRHFFSTFPDSCQFPALPDWLLHRPMGSVLCVPKSPPISKKYSNRIQPESNSRGKKNRKVTRTSKVADLTYKNTWSSFLKSAQSDKVTFFPTKSPPTVRSTVRFCHSWEEPPLVEAKLSDRPLWRQSRSTSPIRRKNSSVKGNERKYSKIESRALREAWLNETIFPNFGHFESESEPYSEVKPIRKDSDYIMTKFVSESPGQFVKNRVVCANLNRKGDSIEANASSGTTDTFLSPNSLDVNATSTLPTTSDSVNVNATSSPTTSFDSMEPHYSPYRGTCSKPCSSSSLMLQPMNSSDTNQSVDVQVSSTLTNSSNTSIQAHISSSSSVGHAHSNVNEIAREILRKERAISSAGSRKSCLKERKSSAKMRDPCRLDWTKRYLYTLRCPIPQYYSDRSSSLSRVSSSSKNYHVYTIKERPWQSNPDLRLDQLSSSFQNDDSFDIKHFLRRKKNELFSQLLQEKTCEEDSYRSLKREIRSLAMLRSSSLPRCFSANRNKNTLQILNVPEEKIHSQRQANPSVPDCDKSNESLDERGLDRRKKENSISNPRLFHFSTEDVYRPNKSHYLSSTEENALVSSASERSTKKINMKCRSPARPESSSARFDPLRAFSGPLQPASGENKASVLRKSTNRKKYEDEQIRYWLQRQRERERRERLKALRLDPAWSHVRGGDQALEDIEHRRCYKEVVERERLLQYYMDREEMMTRVWQMPPLFERQTTKIQKTTVKTLISHEPKKETMSKTVRVYSPNKSGKNTKKSSLKVDSQTTDKRSKSAREKRCFAADDGCFMASESLQLSRPSTAKSSTKSLKRAT